GSRIVQFGARQIHRSGSLATRNEHLAIGQQGGGVTLTGDAEGTCCAPKKEGRIVKLSGGKVPRPSEGLPARNKHLAATQQCRCVIRARGGKRPGETPNAIGGIIKLGRNLGAGVESRDENFAVRQERGGVIQAYAHEETGASPTAGGRIVELRTGQIGAIIPASDEHLAIGKKGGGMVRALGAERARVVQVPGAGS